MNKVLKVDLTNQSYSAEELPDKTLDLYLGGRGLGAYLLYQNLAPGVDPLSPDNPIIFSGGPVQGTNTYYSSRAVLTTKSPLTGIYLFSVASGRFGHGIRKAGYMSVMVQGRSETPVYLAINDGEVQFRSAGDFWGMKTAEAQTAMLEDAKSPDGSCVCIGPAGENLSSLALVATAGEKVRTFGRGGAGAVMGSKNLKGIVISGSRDVTIADPETFEEVKGIIRKKAKDNPKWLESRKRFGTGADIMVMNELGILPTRNWQTGHFDGIKGIALTEIEDIWPRETVPCGPYCLSPCSHVANIDRGPWKGARTEGPEYESLYAFGTNCGVDRFDAIVASDVLCDAYGIDTISCGCAVGFAMECYEKGLITKEETGGIDLRFGDAEAMVKAVEMIAKGEGLGLLFGHGVRRASEKIPGSEAFAMHCKGLEFGGYECRGGWGQALQFALASRGGCHHAFGLPARTPDDRENGMQVTGKGDLLKRLATVRTLFDSTVLCGFSRVVFGTDSMLRIINAITGKDISPEMFEKIGFRIVNLERLINIREGLGRKDDFLPQRLVSEPLPEGPNQGQTVPMDELLDEGYKAMGWDNRGVPLKETLRELDLEAL